MAYNHFGIVDSFTEVNDYIDSNGDIVKGAPCKTIIVTEADDLSNLTGYAVGSIAYTAGFGNIWQLNNNDEWVAIVVEEVADEGEATEEVGE